MSQDIIAHLETCYLISSVWGNKPLPIYKPGQWLSAKDFKKPRRCTGVCWLADGWHYTIAGYDRYFPETTLTLFKLAQPGRECNFAVGDRVQIAMLQTPQTLVVGLAERREWWGLGWCVWVQFKCGNILLSEKDVEAIA